MTAREIAELLDKQATLELQGSGLVIGVRIVNARENFGRIDVLVTPMEGSGQAWVNAERVTINGLVSRTEEVA